MHCAQSPIQKKNVGYSSQKLYKSQYFCSNFPRVLYIVLSILSVVVYVNTFFLITCSSVLETAVFWIFKSLTKIFSRNFRFISFLFCIFILDWKAIVETLQICLVVLFWVELSFLSKNKAITGTWVIIKDKENNTKNLQIIKDIIFQTMQNFDESRGIFWNNAKF